MNRLLVLIDRLASQWLDWRTDRAIASDPALQKIIQETGLKRVEATGPHSWEALWVTPAGAMIAAEMAAMLEKANAKNYVQFDMMSRLDRGLRPIRVTVQWADGEAPATKAARLERELGDLRLLFQRFFTCDDRGEWFFDGIKGLDWYPGDDLQKEIKALLD